MRLFVAAFMPMIATAAFAQAPSQATLVLSLSTMSKALAGCRESYTHAPEGNSEPLVKPLVGSENYEKDLHNLELAEKLVHALIGQPDKVTGRLLVAVLSTTDDFSIGIGSTRTEVLRHIIIDSSTTSHLTSLTLEAEALNACQKSLFNAGDDYVDLVMKYVGAEDEEVASKQKGKR